MGDAGALGQKVQASDSASSSDSAGASYTVNTNLTLREMLAKPMGCVNADLLNDSFNTIKSNTERGFHVNDISKDGSQTLYVWDNQNSICENMTYHGLPFSNFRLDIGKHDRRIKYQFEFKKNIDAYRVLDMPRLQGHGYSNVVREANRSIYESVWKYGGQRDGLHHRVG